MKSFSRINCLFLHNESGVSLIELILIIIILGIGISMLVSVMATGTKESHTPEMVARGVFLAQDLLEEIKSKDFEEPSGPPGSFGTEEAIRKDYDDVDDYDGWGPVSPPEDLNGNPMNQFSGFSRSATVCNVDEGDLDTCVADGSTDYKKITVTLASSETSITLESIRTNY